MASQRVKVVIVGHDRGGYGEELVRGVAGYVRAHADWDLCYQYVDRIDVEALRHWGVEGAIAHVLSYDVADQLKTLGCPVINIGSHCQVDRMPRVAVDDRATGEMAGEHLLQRGYESFAYVGHRDRWYSDLRFEGYAASLRQREAWARRIDVPYSCGMRIGWLALREADEVIEFFRSLPRPCGLFSPLDSIARSLAMMARELGLQVPDDLAVLGAGDTEAICTITEPHLSSVRLPIEQVGYRAAKELRRIFDGQGPTSETVLIPPVGVTGRASTDTVAVQDPHVGHVLRVLRKRFHEPITIEEVADEVPISRRRLEVHFKRIVGRTMRQELERFRLNEARRLLAEAELSFEEIARRCGFSSAFHFSSAFRRVEGQTPRDYRRQWRQADMG